MGRAFAPMLALGLTGCAQIWGIDSTTSTPDAPKSPGVSLSMERISVGATITRGPLDMTGYMATYLAVNGAGGLERVPATLTAPNTWSADIVDGTPPVLFTFPETPTSHPRLWSLPARNLKGTNTMLEHANAEAAPAGVTFDVSSSLPSAYNGELLQFYSVGTWRYLNFPAPALGAGQLVHTFQYSDTISMTGGPPEKITTADVLMLLRYTANTLTAAAIEPGFDQTGNASITRAMATLALDQTLDVTVDPVTPATRFAAVMPATTAGLAMNWSLTASPGHTVALTTGPSLTSGAKAMTDPSQITAMYANPFAAGWAPTFTWATSTNRRFTPASTTTPVTLYSGMYQVILPTPSLAVDLPAALPMRIAIDGTPLTSDGLTVPIDPAKAVDVAITAEHANNSAYQIVVIELVPNTAGTALEYKVVASTLAVAPMIKLTPELFVVGRRYTIRAICLKGSFPAIGAGDLTVRGLPLAVSYLDSGVFTVAAQ